MAVNAPAAPRFPGLTLKAWAHVNTFVAGGASCIVSSSGITSIVRGAVGQGTVTFSSNMATANYVVFAEGFTQNAPIACTVNTRAVGSFVIGESANRDWVGWIGIYE